MTARATTPALASLVGLFNLAKTATATAVRGLYKLQGAFGQTPMTSNDTDVRDVVNALVDAVELGGGGGIGDLRLVLKTYAASPTNITLTSDEAFADMLVLAGAPGDDVHTLTFPLVSGGFVPRADGMRLLVFNSTGRAITMTDPWGNSIVFLTSSTFELVWSPTAGAMSVIFVGPTTLRALNNTVGTTRGTILYCGASGWTTLAPGTTGQVLTATTGGDPHWA